jgi:hypothetical protein
MGARDSIDWCQHQIDNAQDRLADIARGARFSVNGQDITSSISEKATDIIASMTKLIRAYTKLLR